LNAKLIAISMIMLMTVSSLGIVYSAQDTDEPIRSSSLPVYTGGYGYDVSTATMTDHNGFEYSYLPDGIIKLVLPWGYTTYFSFGLTASYLGVAQRVTALSYTWTWTATAIAQYNATGVFDGYDYTFKATNSATLLWTIQLDFFADGSNMKITHSLKNNYPNALTGAEFWFVFDLTHTPTPSVTTRTGTYYPPLYVSLPASITWARLSNQFQFDWRNAGWPNGHAYLGSGSIVGLTVDILGIGILLGDIPAGATRTVDPYFSGVTRTWAATGNSYSGIAASWNPAGVPATGDNITFDATSTYNCNWNTTVTVGDLSLKLGYSGIVLLLANCGMNNFTISQGTWSVSMLGGIPLYRYTVSGKILCNGGTLSADQSWMILSGVSQTVTITSGTQRPYMVEVATSASYTLTTAWQSRQLLINNASSLSVNVGNSFEIFSNGNGYQCRVYGTIAGSGTLAIYLYGYPMNLGLGGTWTISDVLLASRSSTTKNDVFSLTGAWATSGSVRIISSHATYTTALDLSTSNHAFSCAGLTIGTRGILLGRGSRITDSGAWDSSAGTFTPGTSSVHLTGTTKTVKTAPGSSFWNLGIEGSYTSTSQLNVSNNLVIDTGKSLALGGNVKTWNYFQNGTTTLNGYTVTVNNDQAPVITSTAITSVHFTDAYSYDVNATDREGTLTYGMTSDCPDLSIVSGTGVISGTEPLANGTFWVHATVSDGNHTVYQNYSLYIWNDAPVVTSRARYTVLVLDSYLYEANGTDSEGYSLTFNCTFEGDWLTWNVAGSYLSGVPYARDIGYFNVSISVWDGYETSYQNYTIQVYGELGTSMNAFIIYFASLIVFLAIGLIGFFGNIPFISVLAALGTLVLAIPALLAFQDYYILALILIIVNMCIGVYGSRGIRG